MGIKEDIINFLNGYKEEDIKEETKEEVKEEPKVDEPKEETKVDEKDLYIKSLEDSIKLKDNTIKNQSEQIKSLKEFTNTTKKENKELTLQEAIMKGEF